MGLMQILAIIGFAIDAAPRVVQVLGMLVRIFTGPDVRVDEVQKKALSTLDQLLEVGIRTSSYVESLDFPNMGKGDADSRRFEETLATIHEAAKAVGETLSRGQLETITQNCFAIARYGSVVPILAPGR